jgi:hypothetical protein
MPKIIPSDAQLKPDSALQVRGWRKAEISSRPATRDIEEGVTSVKRLVFMNQPPGAGFAREFALKLGARADVK